MLLNIKPFSMIHVTECTIHKKANEHYTAKVAGYVDAEHADEVVMSCPANQIVTIEMIEEETAVCLFKGIVDDITVASKNKLKELRISARSLSCLLDEQEKIRTFQNENLTYKKIAEFISSQNKNSIFIYTEGLREKTNGMVVQYQETDWEFLKRMASQLQTVLVSDCKNDNICICFGMPHKADVYQFEDCEYQFSKNAGEYLFKRKNGMNDLSEQDAMEYKISSREALEIGTGVKFLGQSFLVNEVYSQFTNGELLHTYYLRPEKGCRTVTYTNAKIIGSSITGRVLDLRNDLVKVAIDSDDDRPDGVAKWFHYATNYSSPDGTGWYCMPEEGDTIRVYFPDAIEDHAYVASSVHLGAVDSLRQNPDEKSIRTIHDKEIRFTPKKILITNHKGLSITLDDEKGISIHSNKEINIDSTGAISIQSDALVSVAGDQGVLLQQNMNTILIQDGIRECGTNILRQ